MVQCTMTRGCLDSPHMRLGRLAGSGFDVLGWGLSCKGSVWSVVVVEMGEAVDERLDLVDRVGDFVDGVEFVAPCALQRSTAPLSCGRLGGSS